MNTSSFSSLISVAQDVSRETFDSLVELDRLLHRWNTTINLVAPSTLEHSWKRHILDSAQLWPLVGGSLSIADLGSGGGFPGLVLGILLKERENGAIRLIESNHKKAAFLQSATAILQIPAKTLAKRIENAVAEGIAPEIITARALAPLGDLFALTEQWLLTGARCLFHKGRDYERELEESTAKWRFDLIIHRSKIDAESVILDISNVARIVAER